MVLVQTSFERIRPILEPAAMMFYDRLFALDPSLRGMFRPSREAQAQKLAQALAAWVDAYRWLSFVMREATASEYAGATAS